MSNSTVISINMDITQVEKTLARTKKLSYETYNSWKESASKVALAEQKLSHEKQEQNKHLLKLEKTISDIGEKQKNNNKISKEEIRILADTKAKLAKLNKEYIAKNKASSRNIRLIRAEATAQSKFNEQLKKEKIFIEGVIREKNKEASATNKVTSAINKSTASRKKENAERRKGINTLVRHIRRVESLIVSYYALNKAGSLLIKDGIMLNKTIEDGKVGIGALITANTTLADSMGNQLTPAERFQASMMKSEQTIQALKKASIATSATFPELTSVFQVAIGKAFGAGDAMGQTVDDVINNTIKLSQRLTNIAGSTSMEMFKVTQEIRAILAGDITKDAEIAQMLGITSDDIAEAKKSVGGLAKFLEEKLAVFDVLETEKTFSKSLARMTDAMDTVRLEATKPIFDDLAGAMDDIAIFMKENKDDIVEGYKEIYESIKDGAKFIMEHKDSIEFLIKAYALWKASQIALNVASSASLAISKKHIAVGTALGLVTDKNTLSLSRYAKFQLLSTKRAFKQASAYKRVGMALRATPYGIAIAGASYLAIELASATMETDNLTESTKKLKKELTTEQKIIEKTGVVEKEISLQRSLKKAIDTITEARKKQGIALSEADERAIDALRKRLQASKNQIKEVSSELESLEQIDLFNKIGYGIFSQKERGEIVADLKKARLEVMELLKTAKSGTSEFGDLKNTLKLIGKEINKVNSASLLTKVGKKGKTKEELEADAKKIADLNFKILIETNKLKDLEYTNELLLLDRLYGKRKKAGADKIALEKWFSLSIDEINEKYADKDIQRQIKKLELLDKKDKAWILIAKQRRKELAEEGITGLSSLRTIRKEKKEYLKKPKPKEVKELSDTLGEAIASGFIEGVKTGDFTGMFDGISSALMQPITKELESSLSNLIKGEKGGFKMPSSGSLGEAGVGMAIGLATSYIETAVKNINYETMKPFEDAITKFENAVGDFAIQADKARTFGFEGQGFTADIGGVLAKKQSLQATANQAVRAYSDEWAKTIAVGIMTLGTSELFRDKSILGNLETTLKQANKNVSDYSVGTEIAKIAQGAIGFFDGFKDLSDQLSGTDSFKKARIEKAKQNLSGISQFLSSTGEVTDASFKAGIANFAGFGDELEELVEILGVAKEGSVEYGDALTGIQDILGAGTTAQQALDLADSVNIMADSVVNATSSIESAVASLSSTIDAQQNFLDTNRGLVEGSGESVVRLNDRLQEEILQANEAKKALADARASGVPWAEFAEAVNKEESDVLSLGQMVIDASQTAFASTDTATDLISNVLNVVSERQEGIIDIQQALQEEATITLKSIDATLTENLIDINENIAILASKLLNS